MIKRKNAIQKGDYVYSKKNSNLRKPNAIIKWSIPYCVTNVFGNDLEISENTPIGPNTYIVKKNKVRNAKKYLTQDGSRKAEKKAKICFWIMGYCKLYFVVTAICLMVLTIIGKTEVINYFSLPSIAALVLPVIAPMFNNLYAFYNGVAMLYNWYPRCRVNIDTPTEEKK